MTIPPIPEHLQPVQPAPVEEPQPLTVTAEPASKLEQLHALFPETKAALDDATAKHKAVTDAIKVELTQRAPEERRFELTSSTGAPALRLTWSVSQRLDSKSFKAAHPDLYAAFVKPSGSWTLKAGS